MTFALGLATGLWATALGLVLWGTWLAIRHFRHRRDPRRLARAIDNGRCRPISILKPVKGAEPALAENLESFFRLDYPKYEILFSIADPLDQARAVIERLISKYPRVRARLIVGDVNVGPNPKVNNLVKSQALALHDWILISDSNVRVEADYLRVQAAQFDEDVGILTAVVAGTGPRHPAAWLEAIFLNTFYARWMLLAPRFGEPVVVGKSMLFRRSQASRFGGITALGRYLAEDFMAGQAMQKLGLRVEVLKIPVDQPLPRYSLADFWRRHVRWGRIRKAQAPAPFYLEILCSSWFSGWIGALALEKMLGVPAGIGFGAHLLAWCALDLVVQGAVAEPPDLRHVLAWLAREVVAVPLWIHIACGNTVNWRGRRLILQPGGLVVEKADGIATRAKAVNR